MYYITSYKANSDQFSHDAPQESLRTLLLLPLLLKIIKLVLFLRVSRLQGSGGDFLSNVLSTVANSTPIVDGLFTHTVARKYLRTYNELGNEMLIFA